MPDTITCANCGTLIADESLSADPVQRKPCPQCGSTARPSSEHVELKITVSVTAQEELITYPQELLSIAKSLIDSGLYNIAVVVSHMACEIATERAFANSFTNKGIQYLENAVTSLLNGYNITNDRVRTLYTALTDDDIQKQPFWQRLKESTTRRNKIIHKGLTVGKTEAEDSHQVASDLVVYLNK